ncbi:MAG: hypothetical protein M5U26_04350 [Planctomycetota bacterium]|nr:hypothetical protein [Planctomycetota bacterium]
MHLGLAGADPGELLDHRWPAATFRVDGPPIDAFGFGLSGTLAFEHRWETRAQAAAPTAQGLWPAPRPLRLVCNSWPKAGTHLLQEVAKGLLGEGTWYRQAELIHPPGGEPVLLDALQAKFEAAGERGAVLGHFPWSPALERAFLDRGWKTLFIIRDPRDMLCSTLRWMLDLRPDWAISRHMRELPGDDARLAAIIAGLPVLAPLHRNVDVAWDKPLPHRLERLTPWTSSAHACTLRFEDLLGGPDEDARRRQEAELRRALEYLGDDGRVPLAELARGLFNPLSATFHSAQRGTWRRYFKPEHRALFLETGGEELVRRFGYPPTEAGEQP